MEHHGKELAVAQRESAMSDTTGAEQLLRAQMQSLASVAGSAAAGGSLAIAAEAVSAGVSDAKPEPKYDAQTAFPAACYFPDCPTKYKGNSMGHILNHVKTIHQVKMNDITGTYLASKGTDELTQVQKTRREAAPPAKKAKRNNGTRDKRETSPMVLDHSMPAAAAAAPTEAAAPAEAAASSLPNQSLCQTAPKALFIAAVEEFDRQSEELNHQSKQTDLVERYGYPLKGDALAMAPPPKHIDTSTQLKLSSVLQPITSPAVSLRSAAEPTGLAIVPDVAAAVPPHVMLETLYNQTMRQQKEEETTKNWKQSIPSVKLKQSWIEAEMPMMKREGSVKRASTPKLFKSDKVSLNSFKMYLNNSQKGSSNIEIIYLGACRVMGALEVDEAMPIDDVKVLVGLYLSETYLGLQSLGLLHEKYHWTPQLFDGLGTYCIFWIWKVNDMLAQNEKNDPILAQYKICIELLAAGLKGAHLKKCREFKEATYAAKKKEDLYVIKNFPSIQGIVQPAVWKAYCLLRQLGEKYASGGQAAMEDKDRSLANTLLVGCWQCDTFLGRHGEIKYALHNAVSEAIASCVGYLLANWHKTHKTYGDIIKMITAPGLEGAVTVYNSFPRPEGCKYFFVPVKGKGPISFSGYLARFNKLMLKDADGNDVPVKPTSNQWRKKFHNELRKLTKDQEKLQDMMTILDANGRKVQSKHYIMDDPDEDHVLAKALVQKVLGTTVPWPSKAEAEAESTKQTLEQMVEEELANAAELQPPKDDDAENKEEEQENSDDDDDEELDWWECGEFFGIANPKDALTPLLDADAAETGAIPLQDDGSIEESLIADSSGGRGSKRDAAGRIEIPLECSEDKSALWKSEKYWEPPLVPGMRKSAQLDPIQSEWIMDKLREWQRGNAPNDAFAKPSGAGSNDWYYDLRVDAIDAKIITKHYSQDICKSHIANILKKAKAAEPGAASKSVDVD